MAKPRARGDCNEGRIPERRDAGVVGALVHDAARSGAFGFGLQDGAGATRGEKEVLGRAREGGDFADGDARAGGEVRVAAVLQNPHRGGEGQRRSLFALALLALPPGLRACPGHALGKRIRR